VAPQTIEEGLARYSLGLLTAEEIPQLAMLFLDEGCDVPEMAALAGSLAPDHPSDRRSDLERAVPLTGRAFPTRLRGAQLLQQVYAQRASSGTLSPRHAAKLIIDISQLVERELPATEEYLGDSFGIAPLVGLFYSYDDVPFDDIRSVREIDRELLGELARLARGGLATEALGGNASPPEEIHVALVDEGVAVWRPVLAQRIDGDMFLILKDQAYDRSIERWQFEPGQRVRCEVRRLDVGPVRVAIDRA
jgi:hypothetical protein